MNKRDLTKMQRFEAAIEAYGSDFSNWPPDAHELFGLIREDQNAARLYEEAKALDQLLVPSTFEQQTRPLDQLEQCILADFKAVSAPTSGKILPFKGGKVTWFHKTAQKADWGMAAALAACFVVGLYLGGFGVGEWRLDPASSLASLSDRSEQSVEIANDVISSGLEEGLL